MPWVRAHYRRSRGSRGGDIVALILLSAIVGGAWIVYRVVTVAVEVVEQHPVATAATAIGLCLVAVAPFVYKLIKRQRMERLAADAAEVERLRREELDALARDAAAHEKARRDALMNV